MKKQNLIYLPVGALGVATFLSGAALMSSGALAATTCTTNATTGVTTCTSDPVTATVNVSQACTLTAENGTTTHSISINPGSSDTVTGATLQATCNNTSTHYIQAQGYSGAGSGTAGNTDLVGSSSNIATGTATSGATSNWAMKLETVAVANTTPAILNNYGSFKAVPSSATQVASFSTTTIGTASKVKATYQIYIASTQTPDTYTGRVMYSIVEP